MLRLGKRRETVFKTLEHPFAPAPPPGAMYLNVFSLALHSRPRYAFRSDIDSCITATAGNLESRVSDDTLQYQAAVLGGSGVLDDLLALYTDDPHTTSLPGITLTAVASCPSDKADAQTVKAAGAQLHDSAEELLAAHPDVNLVFLLDEECLSPDRLAELGKTALVLGRDAVVFLINLVGSMPSLRECEIDLAHTRSMLDTVFNHVSEDILLLDAEGRIIDINKNVYERRGKSKADFVGFYVWEALDEQDNLCKPPEFKCPLSKTIKEEIPAEAVYTNVDDEGRLRYFRVYTYPIFDEHGQLNHVAEVRRDITRRTYMEQRLQQSEKLAAIGELSTFIAHEIRNPLFAISGFANSLLRNQGLDDDAQEKVRIILKESKRLDQILKSILNFSRPTAGDAAEVDVNKVVAETVEVMRLGLERLGIDVVQETFSELPLAKGDPELLKQCLINLIKNSMEAMEENSSPQGHRIAVRTYMNDQHVVMEVADDGPGIPEENLDKVFNPFYSTRDKGSGLGLAMIKKILDDLGGQVDLQSQEGAGTTVRLMLPPLLAVSEETQKATEIL
jgi:PAS domain S-box-containing protein